MNSGYYVGQVDAYTVLDFNVDVRVPRIAGATVGLSGTNILDNRHNQFVGAPELGALWLIRVGYAF
jgi:outer membrane receptor protein involved in Fe transport